LKPEKREVKPLDDNACMEDVKDGKVEKLAVLFERHHVSLFNFFLRLTGNRGISEDLVQDVFTRILKYRTTYKGESRFTTWMYQIARNVHVDHLRKSKDELSLDDRWEDVPSRDASPPDRVERGEDIAMMHQALAKLSLRKREVLLLSRFQNMKYTEIADLFGWHVGTVKATVHRAIKDLGKFYFELSGGTAP